ncbi:predicted protein [Histoplasma capsulatum G186AR]|uniref:Uncharacterized protein n=1 Tax=Ajellomyces capsulatus (strain G186AR / H82 / ATCC MYA-2454 / RMSCC 2432) TaxID=447093 RepID=C0NSZ4_AJECG|nr:uncharacterized protein HCBG_06274 [Histoplasma capsulatum G186AR]EEH05155.1 predicted protein [Histoplasma capsulatum G186AR]
MGTPYLNFEVEENPHTSEQQMSGKIHVLSRKLGCGIRITLKELLECLMEDLSDEFPDVHRKLIAPYPNDSSGSKWSWKRRNVLKIHNPRELCPHYESCVAYGEKLGVPNNASESFCGPSELKQCPYPVPPEPISNSEPGQICA